MRRIPRLFFLPVVVLCACSSSTGPTGYFGPTLTLSEVVGRINENNAKISTIWAREHFEGQIVDREKKKSDRIDGYGNLLFTSPNQMRLTAKDEFTDFFDMGSDGKLYWLWDKHGRAFWWGDFTRHGDLDSEEFPIRPDMVMEILGVKPVDRALMKEPAPTMRFENYADAYMLDWHEISGDHWKVSKEIWYDRQTLLPKKVLLFDGNGRVILWATLSNFLHVKMESGDESQWPMMASEYHLSFPYTGTTISFELSDVSSSHKSGNLSFPNAATYRMPDPETLIESGVRVNHIDDR